MNQHGIDAPNQARLHREQKLKEELLRAALNAQPNSEAFHLSGELSLFYVGDSHIQVHSYMLP